MHITFLLEKCVLLVLVRCIYKCVCRAQRNATQRSQVEKKKRYEAKNLSSLKFNLNHMADASASNNDNHGMHVNQSKLNQTKTPNSVCSAAIGDLFNIIFFTFLFFVAFFCSLALISWHFLPCVHIIFRLL